MLTMLPMRVLSQLTGIGRMIGYRHMMSHWEGGVAGGIILLVALGVMIHLLIRNLHPSQTDDVSCHETPLEVLKKRYARGEITKDEFEQMKQSL